MKRVAIKAAKKILGMPRYEYCREKIVELFSKDRGYNRKYYEYSQSHNSFCYSKFAGTLCEIYHPKTVIELGCGNGGVSLEFQKLGCDVYAFDYSKDAVAMAMEKGVKNVQRFNICGVDLLPKEGDLAVCMEVAEHIPAKFARHLCEVLARSANVVVMSAAPPGQGGHLHVNEQPKEYWIELMKSVGMEFHQTGIEDARGRWRNKMSNDYDQNLMIFRRA